MRFLSNRRSLSISLLIFVFLPCTVLAQYQPPGSVDNYLDDPAPRSWDLSIRTFMGYDDNVPLVPHSTACGTPGGGACAPGSFYGGFSIKGNYRLVQNDTWLAGVGLSFDQTFHGKTIGPACCTTDGRDYNLTAFSPSVFGRYFFGFLFGRTVMPASLGMSYAFRREWLPITGPFSTHTVGHTLNWDLAVDVIRQLKLGINYSLGFQDFNHVQSTDARDATAHGIGVCVFR